MAEALRSVLTRKSNAVSSSRSDGLLIRRRTPKASPDSFAKRVPAVQGGDIVEIRQHPLGWAAYYAGTILFTGKQDEAMAFVKRCGPKGVKISIVE
jgi:hypothetical protein